MKILYKLLSGFLLVALLSCVVAYFGMDTINSIDEAYNSVEEKTLPIMDSLEQMRFSGIEIASHTEELVRKPKNEILENDTNKIKQGIEKFDESFRKYEGLVDNYFPKEKEYLGEINSTGKKIKEISSDLVRLKIQDSSDEEILKKFEEFEDVEDDFLGAIQIALDKENEEFAEESIELESIIVEAKNTILIASLLTLFTAIIIGSIVSKSISDPIVKLKDAADEIDSGNLNARAYIESGDEFGALSGTFNKMVKDLSEEISGHKQSAESLKQKNEFVKTVLESLSYPFYVINVNDYSIALANSAACEEGSAEGSSCYALIHRSDKPCGTKEHKCPLEEVKKTGKPVVVEHIHYDKNGNVRNMEVHSYPIFDKHGNVVQVIEYSMDITERKEFEAALAESEERFRSVAQSASDPMITSDGNGNIIFWNHAAEKKFGYKNDEILGKPLTILMPGRYREAHLNGLKRIATTGESHVIGNTVELVALKKGGGEFPIELSLSKWNNRGKIFYSGIMRDITERKRNEEIRLENERLALANKAKSEFLMIMSHELRTPLNAILGFSELIKDKNVGDLSEKQIRYADNIHSSGKHLLSLIDDILDLTKIESGKTEVILDNMFVAEAIDESVELIKEQAAKQNIEIKKQIAADIEFIETDRNKFRQVLNNLLGNAIKFSKSEGGMITITTEKEKDVVKFSISDTGIGIKEEDMGRLFQSFEQLDVGIARKYEGTGLGLSVSKKLVELLGGRITAESRYDEGSTFTFYLPIEAKKSDLT